MSQAKETRVSQWYFGGLASAGAACVTHPLDLLKVQMQTQKGKNISMIQLTGIVLRNQGIMGLYNGISASLLRQLTYSTARFGIYEGAKQQLSPKDGQPIPFYMSAFLAGLGGCAGGFVGNPADLVNVRMQNDVKLPPEQRRNVYGKPGSAGYGSQDYILKSLQYFYIGVTSGNSNFDAISPDWLDYHLVHHYKNAVHGLYRVLTEEGIARLWAGGTMNCSRAILMTIGQLSFYDQIKAMLLASPYFEDNVITHVTSSLLAGAIATTLTQPVDVLKTRAMNAKPGEVKSVIKLIRNTALEGPLTFFKGYIPAFVRLAPHTILTFVFLEQLRINVGTVKIIT